MNEKEHLKWLEEREQKLEQLEKIIKVLFATDDIINKIIKILKQVLNQESILKQVQEITISFE